MRAQNETHHHLFDTALGTCGVAWNARGLVAVQLPEKTRAATERRLAVRAGSAGTVVPPAWVDALTADIQKYLAGERVDFSTVAVDLENLEPFRQRLYAALRETPFGSTITYGELAQRLGLRDPQGARDIGAAMGQNPAPLVIPCHRVLAAGGKLGGFSAPGGSATKAKLLALEGVHFDKGAPRLPGL